MREQNGLLRISWFWKTIATIIEKLSPRPIVVSINLTTLLLFEIFQIPIYKA